MPRQIFVNLPVADLQKSIEFFKGLGFAFDPKFTDDSATCMIVAENIFVMLVTHVKFKAFTPRDICDTARNTEVLVCLTLESREAVQEMVARAVAQGGRTYTDPQDHPLMFGHGFHDLDGHIWELLYFSANPELNLNS